jgi:CRP-like cAMP-binding protein
MAFGSDDQAISPALRQQLLQISKFAIQRAGTVLFRRGDPCAGLFLILSGRVRMVLEPSIAVFPERVLGPGCVLGLPSVMAGAPYSLTAVVVDDAELAHVTQQELTECLRRDPELCFDVMEMLSHEISETRTAIKRVGSSANARSQPKRPTRGGPGESETHKK